MAMNFKCKHLTKHRTSAIARMENAEKEDDHSSTRDAINRKQTEEILKNISKYPFGLFKVEIKRQLVKEMIEQEVMEFGNFIENCAKTPSFLKVFDRSNVEVEETCGSKVFDHTTIWDDEAKDLVDKIQDKGAEEKLITVKVLDLPFLHHYENGDDNYIY